MNLTRQDTLLRLLRAMLVVFIASLVLVARADAQTDRKPPEYIVIVNPRNKVSSLTKGDVSSFFLKKVSRWPDGTMIRPVDLHMRSEVRKDFTNGVLGRTIGAVRSYWQQAIFSGRDVPPPEVEDEATVVRYVLSTKGGIGYVSPDTRLWGAKVIEVR